MKKAVSHLFVKRLLFYSQKLLPEQQTAQYNACYKRKPDSITAVTVAITVTAAVESQSITATSAAAKRLNINLISCNIHNSSNMLISKSVTDANDFSMILTTKIIIILRQILILPSTRSPHKL